MKIKVATKSIGKRKQSVEPISYEIQGHPSTVRDLIFAVTQAEVITYNKHIHTSKLLALLTLTEAEIADQAQAGRISFGENHGEKEADVQEAQENALQCFEDGIYRIFMDETLLESLDDTIAITEQNVFTFVRLTMLAGRMW